MAFGEIPRERTIGAFYLGKNLGKSANLFVNILHFASKLDYTKHTQTKETK